MFSKFKGIQGKFVLLIAVLIVFSTVLVAYLSISQLANYGKQNIDNLTNQLIANHKTRLQGLTDTVYSLLLHYNQLVEKGELTVEEAQELALSRLEAMRYDDGSGYYWIHSAKNLQHPVMVMHPIKPQLNGTDLSNINDFDTVEKIFYNGEIYPKNSGIVTENVKPVNLFVKMNEVCLSEGAGFVKYYWSKAGAQEGVGYPKLSYVKIFKPWDWVVGTGFYIDDVDKETAKANALTISNVNNARWKIIAATIVCLITGLLLSLLFTSRLIKPLKEMVLSVKHVAEGDLTQEIKVKSKDEIGILASTFNQMVGDLKNIITGIQDSSDKLASYSQELASSSEEVTATAEEVAGTTNEVAAISSSGAESAEAAAKESEQVRQVAEEGNKAVQETVEKINSIYTSTKNISGAMHKLGEQSEQIGQIINTITSIADQTNLLALNAAIEAARAGEHGRGFAVVAEEVRKLAEQSANAANEITGLIEQIQVGIGEAINAMDKGSQEVNEGVEIAGNAGAALEQIIKAVEKNIAIIKDVAAGSQRVNEGTQQLSTSNEQITCAIQQVSGSAQELANIAGELQNAVIKFRVNKSGSTSTWSNF